MILSLSIDYFQNVHGITCVENQFSVILKHLGLPLEAVYLDSFIDLSSVIEEFITRKTAYAYYKGIARFQSTAKRIGIAKLTLHKASYDEVINELNHSLSKGYPLLVRVDPNKLPRTGEIVPWREDHFISLYGSKNEIILALDDVPQRMLSLSGEEFKDAYQNEMIVFNKLESFDKNLYIKEVEEQLKRITMIPKTEEKKILDEIPYDLNHLISLRDAIGILKISRYRTKAWLKWLESVLERKFDEEMYCEFDNLINKLERIFSSIEFAKLRKKVNPDKLKNLMKDIYLSDLKCLEYISSIQIR